MVNIITFTCKGCGSTVPQDYSIRTKGFCYMCDPEVSIIDLLNFHDGKLRALNLLKNMIAVLLAIVWLALLTILFAILWWLGVIVTLATLIAGVILGWYYKETIRALVRAKEKLNKLKRKGLTNG